jgi:hypothetical protein
MYDFAKPLQIPTDGFAPHLKGFAVKLHRHKQTKLFSIFILKTKSDEVLHSLVVVKNPYFLDFHWLESNIQSKRVFRLNATHI